MTPSLEARIYAAVQALVDGRAYPELAPPEVARPYIVFGSVSTGSSYTLARVGNTDRRRMQIDVYDDAGKSFEAFDQLAREVRFALESAGGRLQDGETGREPGTDLRRARLDIAFWHRPA